VIAPDGQSFSALDVIAGTTKIFSLREAEMCRQITDLGYATGKVAFSPSGKRIAFQVVGPDGGHQAVVAELTTRAARRLTGTEESTFFFPVFLTDEKVAILRRGQQKYASEIRIVHIPGEL
jgi:hypothetical protein